MNQGKYEEIPPAAAINAPTRNILFAPILDMNRLTTGATKTLPMEMRAIGNVANIGEGEISAPANAVTVRSTLIAER